MVAFLVPELAARAIGADAPHGAAWVAMGIVLICALRRLGLREAYLLGLCAIASVGRRATSRL